MTDSIKVQLQNYLNRYDLRFETAEVDFIYQKLEQKTIKKRGWLVQEGQVCRYYFFILQGLVRTFYIDDKGNECITQFGIENWWITNLESFKHQTPSMVSIQAIEPTSVLRLSHSDMEMLYEKVPKLERLFRIITERTLIAIQRRSDFYMRKGSKERYDFLMQTIPNFAQRVPQYMLASYLEITPEYLSELRKKQ
ncbi:MULTISPECIES: Crp/Fnr family transcriptional regulator [unclassified Aureispira]|uniref:Crp/Fnr family transcriptional regulator n=1 Tax=unclassified Aureispira TaxID=2649989 RepID=UPI00069675E5|nr:MULTISPECIES: Crp/Fnr family transcriptional regulator [unclassified Aureispira]WMX17437.1 Crp/Fnr family transcriptional regulator [Aureispira sp. CCB-E]